MNDTGSERYTALDLIREGDSVVVYLDPKRRFVIRVEKVEYWVQIKAL